MDHKSYFPNALQATMVLARSSPNVMLRYMKHHNKKNMKCNYEQISYRKNEEEKLQGKT